MEYLAISFLGGLAASLTPCSLAGFPLIVGYIGSKQQQSTAVVILLNLSFMAGLSLVLSILGIAAVLMGSVFGSMAGNSWRIFLAVLIIILGLHTLELLPFKPPGAAVKATRTGGYAGAFAVGAVYAVMSSPCATPILAGILAFAALQGNLIQGFLMLIAYGMGQSFLLVGLGLSTGMAGTLTILRRYSGYMQKISGVLMVGAGIYLAIAQF